MFAAIRALMRGPRQKCLGGPAGLPLCACRSAVGMLAAVLLTSCASTGATVSPTTRTATAGRSLSPTATVLPAPVLTPLAPPPPQCALTPPPRQLTVARLGLNANAQLVGGGVFWIFGAFYSNTFHLGQMGSTEWPGTKMVVEVGPNYSQPVTLQLRDLRTGALAWWTDGQTPPGSATQTLVLDPQTDSASVGQVPGLPDIPHGEVAPGWHEWGLFPIFEVAGCYALHASWSGGSWQSTLAVGS